MKKIQYSNTQALLILHLSKFFMSAFSKIFIFLFALFMGGIAVLFSAHSSCANAKKNLDKAEIEFVEHLSELSSLATKIAAMNKMAFPENITAVKKVEFLQAKLEENLSAVEIIKAHEILDKSLKSMLRNLLNKRSGRKNQILGETAASFKIVSQRAASASTNFLSKAESYNRTLEGFLPKHFSSLMDFQPEQLRPPAKSGK